MNIMIELNTDASIEEGENKQLTEMLNFKFYFIWFYHYNEKIMSNANIFGKMYFNYTKLMLLNKQRQWRVIFFVKFNSFITKVC